MAIIGILAAIAVPLYASVRSSSRIAKAQADTRSLASAVRLYLSHMGIVPASLDLLTSPAINASTQSAGPLMASIPTPPSGWGSLYGYGPSSATGTFTITAGDDGATISVP